MGGPTPRQIEHYVRMFEQLSNLSNYFSIGENLSWTVVHPHQAGLTAKEMVRRLHGEPDAMTLDRPADCISDREYDDLTDSIFLEQRRDVVIIVGFATVIAEGETLRRLSQGATVHSVFWAINNFNALSYLVDTAVVTELDVLWPMERWGTDPEALTDHLDALYSLQDRAAPRPDWETAMATLESLTGQRLDSDWFSRPQLRAKVNPQ